LQLLEVGGCSDIDLGTGHLPVFFLQD